MQIRFRSLLSFAGVCSVSLALARPAIAIDTPYSSKQACGINALYMLLTLLDKPVDLDTLISVLPPLPENGFSLAELRAAGSKLGIPLVGRFVRQADLPLSTPVIAYLNRHKAQSGHFVVLIPTGTTGKLLQVIDPPYPSRVMDFSQVFDPSASMLVLKPASSVDLMMSHRITLITLLIATMVSYFLIRNRHKLMVRQP